MGKAQHEKSDDSLCCVGGLFGDCDLMALYYRSISSVFLYDSNFEVFQSLNKKQVTGVLRSLNVITLNYVWLLTGMNLLWIIAGGSFLMRRGAAR